VTIDDSRFAALETLLARLMLAGVVSSAACLSVGLGLWIAGDAALTADFILTVGLFVLMGTPVLRVTVAVIEAYRMRDWFFLATTLAVMLLLGLTAAHAFGKL
jgi:uncharacterized membrane protein